MGRDLFAEFGRPEAVPPAVAVRLLKAVRELKADVGDIGNVQAFRYSGAEMADAFLEGAENPQPGRRFLGRITEAGGQVVAAFEVTGEQAATLHGGAVSPARAAETW